MAIRVTNSSEPHTCGKCGAETKYESVGPGGGKIVCPNCGPIGVYDCGLPENYWDKFKDGGVKK
jgi:hypothetical protein